jgi:hypothetical protein
VQPNFSAQYMVQVVTTLIPRPVEQDGKKPQGAVIRTFGNLDSR